MSHAALFFSSSFSFFMFPFLPFSFYPSLPPSRIFSHSCLSCFPFLFQLFFFLFPSYLLSLPNLMFSLLHVSYFPSFFYVFFTFSFPLSFHPSLPPFFSFHPSSRVIFPFFLFQCSSPTYPTVSSEM